MDGRSDDPGPPSPEETYGWCGRCGNLRVDGSDSIEKLESRINTVGKNGVNGSGSEWSLDVKQTDGHRDTVA